MGTDIHMRVERRSAPAKKWEVWEVSPLPTSRQYRVFAALAGVRNGAGFAGVYTHEAVEPWFRGRGLPQDLDPAYRDKYIGDHSFTHATVAELLACPWDLEFQEGGVLNEDTFIAWRKEGGAPENWAGRVTGQHVITMTEDQYAAFKEKGADALPASFLAALMDPLFAKHSAQIDSLLRKAEIFGHELTDEIKEALAHRDRLAEVLVPPVGQRQNLDISKAQPHITATWKRQPLLNSCLYRWLTAEDGAIQSAVREIGAENIRLLFGFDS